MHHTSPSKLILTTGLGRASSGCAFRESARSAWPLPVVEGVRNPPMTQERCGSASLPCVVEEIAPYHLKRVTILRIIVIVKFSECVDVPLVYVFEALFVPIGVGACAISPLVDAALYLKR